MKQTSERFPRHRNGEILERVLLMLTLARVAQLKDAIAAKDKENSDLKSQVATLQGQVANAVDPAVASAMEDVANTVLGPEQGQPAPDAPVSQ